jgi:hypothetical protein
VATFVLIHGAGDVGWYWHRVEAELRARGHDTIAPDLPCDDDSAGLPEYADRRVARERLGITPDEIDGGHTPALSRPHELADRLGRYAAEQGMPGEGP